MRKGSTKLFAKKPKSSAEIVISHLQLPTQTVLPQRIIVSDPMADYIISGNRVIVDTVAMFVIDSTYNDLKRRNIESMLKNNMRQQMLMVKLKKEIQERMEKQKFALYMGNFKRKFVSLPIKNLTG